MEKEKLFMNSSGQTLPPSLNWHSSSGMEGQLEEINCNSNQFLNINWENSMDQSAPFESAMSSFVSSPASASNSAIPAHSAAIGELIGRLGGLCNNSRELSQSQMASTNGTDTSCYSTPLNSPPKLELLMMDHQLRGNLAATGNSMVSSFAPLAADPEFAERAAKLSCYGSSNIGGLMGQFFLMGTESGNQLGISNNQSLKTGSQMGSLEIKDATTTQNRLDAEMRPASTGSAPDRKFSRFSRSSTPDDSESCNARVEAVASILDPRSKGLNEANARKRKAKAKEPHSSQVVADDNSNEKRCKAAEVAEAGKDVVKVKNEQSNDSNAGSGGKNQNKDSKSPEPPKQDYIHVRARRGQATDSHSLAERVRREKINERMKFLQDLVPGCNKVTGKAVMLDEIIKYVQSLQRQVEFLSMKLAHVNPRLDFNVEALLSKDILQSRGSLPQTLYPVDSSEAASMFSYGHPPQQMPLQTVGSNGLETGNLLDATVRRDLGTQLPAIEGHRNFSSSQLATLWEDDLNGVISSTHRY